MPTRVRHERQRGVVLVLFALLVVGIFGWLAATVDVGRLRVTAQQLDAAAESASLEGVRFKDREVDELRRTRAIDAVARMFDDDLDLASGDALGLGAGAEPIVAGANPLGGTLTRGRAFKPADGMWANLSNARHGDVVAGTFVPGAGTAVEDDLFRRNDFVPAPQDAGPDAFVDEPALLVRLRRAGSRLALDRVDGESSAGPPFEWLWARGSAWIEPGATGSQQSRADGVTVRATSIASTERALYVSADPARGLGLAPIALRWGTDAAWTPTPVGGSVTLAVESSGILTIAGEEQGVALGALANALGDTVVPAASSPVLSEPEWIVPVYTTLDGARRVVGFALATVSFSGSEFVVQRRPSSVLPSGASSVSPAALDARLVLASSASLQAAHLAVAHPVLAPVLRR